MYNYSDIRTLHLEITSKCNARCPMCLRTVSGGAVNPQLPLTELSLQNIQSFFSEDFICQLQRMYMCGNYGDPMVAQDTLEIFRYFRSINPKIHLSLFTNGSGRSESWWEQVAAVVDVCHFAIDGLGEVNQLYRRKTNFDLIMKSAKAFIKAGGVADWDFIVFRHNEHQIQAAKALSEEMGFRRIQFKKTGRFFSYAKNEKKEWQDVLAEDGSIDYKIFPPENTEFQNSALQSDVVHDPQVFEQYLRTTPITCKTEAEKSIYVSAEGLVFPCCWTALRLYPWYSAPKADPIWKMLSQLKNEKESISLFHEKLVDIIEGEFFQNKLPQAWQSGEHRLKVCAKTCGQKFDPFKSQFSTTPTGP